MTMAKRMTDERLAALEKMTVHGDEPSAVLEKALDEMREEAERARASEAELAEALEGIVVHEEAYHRGDAEVATQARAALAKVSP